MIQYLQVVQIGGNLMVIVFVVDNLKNLSNGTSITAYRFANKLREQGHEVRIITDELTGENIYTLKTRNIPIVSKVAKRQNVTFAKPDKKIIKEALTGADIVHFFVPWKTSRITYKIAKKMGIPMTCAFHVPPASIVYGAGLRFIEKPLLWYIFRRFRRFYKKIKHIHCPSNYIASELIRYCYPNQLHVISNGVDEDFQYTKKETTSNKYQLMMIGRYAPEKKQEVIIKAIAKSKYRDQIHLTLAGIGPNIHRLQTLANKLGVDVTFDFYSKDELKQKLLEQDLYIHSSEIETEGISCLEAIACGRVPIIADSKQSAANQFALDERSLFKAGNENDLCEKIEYWIEHPHERLKMEEIYASSSEKYSLDKSVERFVEMFKIAINDYKIEKLAQSKEVQKIRRRIRKSTLVKTLNIAFYYLVLPLLAVYNKVYLKVTVKNRHNLKQVKTGAVIISNHVHMLDSVMLGLAAFPKRIVFTSQQQNFKMPVVGYLVKALGAVPTPIKLTENKIFFHELSHQARNGRFIGFYPEGELIDGDRTIREFKRGAFKLAVDSSVPIIPVRINFYDQPKRKKQKIVVNVGKPLFPDFSLSPREALDKLKEETEKVMEKLA